jgi:hypothetical protein
MASSGNFPTLNPLYIGQRGTSSNYYPIITQGNTRAHSSSSSDALQISTVENLKTGKWYWEWCIQDNQGDKLMHSGAADSRRDQWDYKAASATYGAEQSIHFHTYFQIVEKNGSDTGAYSSSGSSHSVDDVFGIALDTDNGKFYVHKNGTYYASGNPATGANPGATWTPASEYTDGFTPYFTASGGSDADGILNFGQDSTFGGAISAGGNADGNGFGDFKYAPPTGFLAVCSANLPISDDIDPAQTDDNFPQKNFNTILYTGIGGTSANNVTGVGFQPDLIWIKNREQSAAYGNCLVDSSRGRAKVLYSSRSDAEATSAVNRDISSINSDGFTIQDTSNIDGNQSGIGYVAWCWRANGGTTASNSNGSITSTVQANTKAGFSIITFTSPNSSSDQTVGHGLTKAPEFIIAKNLDTTYNWDCFHIGLSDTTKGLRLNTTDVPLSGRWGTVNATTIGTKNAYTHSGTDDYVFYAWHSVEGYSKFGKFEGNGNANGPFIYTGFRPRMLFVKNIDTSNEWFVQDTARSTHNPTKNFLEWDTSDAEQSNAYSEMDILSNGFKCRGNSGRFNDSATYVYGAWGDVPFKYNNTF